MDPSYPLTSALGMEHHHPILIIIRGHGVHIDIDRDREIERVD